MRYDYECENCGHIVINHSIKDDAWAVCPECKGKIKRLISKEAGQNVIFVGEGFYCNDYKKKIKDVNDPSVSTEERVERRKKAKQIIKDEIIAKDEKRFW